jgi:uncharacterized protein YijF (DUF1287 family)
MKEVSMDDRQILLDFAGSNQHTVVQGFPEKVCIGKVMKMKIFIAIALLAAWAPAAAGTAAETLVASALERTRHAVVYDGAYYAIDYPGGDVPEGVGVCTDVIIRSYRKLGVDLQLLVHQDIQENFSKYPSQRIWGLTQPDTNIDHRRVPNLRVFFSRKGVTLPVTRRGCDYKPGDLVTWMLPGNLPHIGIVTDKRHPSSGNPMIVHNIGRGPRLENMLFDYPITGHYRFLPEK